MDASAPEHPASQHASADVRANKAAYVKAMFENIAGRYDLLNRLLSAGNDQRWRREATHVALSGGATRVLDVATGTADLAIMIKREAPHVQVTGIDFAEPMLQLGRQKARVQGLDIVLEQGDGLNLPYADASFDTVMIAYGLRNFADYRRGLQEFHRVLRPGGRVVILEFPPPPEGPFGQLFRLYFLRVLPFIGGLVSGKRSAYGYLPQSVLEFPQPALLARMMQEAGFTRVKYRLQTFGISALHVGEKP
jgi:demethylmenaquinone methyltransferase/2-methoxy-6-polyprenyl-1,4-benzoquinol methylase